MSVLLNSKRGDESKTEKYLSNSTIFVMGCIFFQGFVISDWQGIDRITSPPHENYTYSIQAGIGAGIDMVSTLNLIFMCYPFIFILIYVLANVYVYA